MSQPAPKAPTEKSLARYVKAWGENPIPPITLATLVAAQNRRPIRFTPAFVAGSLVITCYMNVAGNTRESAGATAAWSAIYLLVAMRRRQSVVRALSVPGVVRGLTMGVAVANVVGGGWAWAVGRPTSVVEEEGG